MATASSLFEKLKDIKVGGTTCLFTEEKCTQFAPLINQINRVKKEKNAIILAHSYVSPEIIYGVADFVGDSYELSKKAKETSASSIVFCAVKFMAETAKVLNPDKEVLIPSQLNGCTLADAITGQDVENLRKQFPDHTFVCYINTSAEVKARCDVCVTSSNAEEIIKNIPNPNIYFLPDKLMGQNLQNSLSQTAPQKSIRFYDGTCYVHEAYDPEMIDYIRLQHTDTQVVSHPECAPEILKKSDFVGSTTQMIQYVKNSPANSFFLLTECGLSTRLQMEVPQKQFVGACSMCRYMKSNTLEDIYRVLTTPNTEDIVSLSDHTRQEASQCIQNMFTYMKD